MMGQAGSRQNWVLRRRLATPNPKPQTPNPKPQTPNPTPHHQSPPAVAQNRPLAAPWSSRRRSSCSTAPHRRGRGCPACCGRPPQTRCRWRCRRHSTAAALFCGRRGWLGCRASCSLRMAGGGCGGGCGRNRQKHWALGSGGGQRRNKIVVVSMYWYPSNQATNQPAQPDPPPPASLQILSSISVVSALFTSSPTGRLMMRYCLFGFGWSGRGSFVTPLQTSQQGSGWVQSRVHTPPPRPTPSIPQLQPTANTNLQEGRSKGGVCGDCTGDDVAGPPWRWVQGAHVRPCLVIGRNYLGG